MFKKSSALKSSFKAKKVRKKMTIFSSFIKTFFSITPPKVEVNSH